MEKIFLDAKGIPMGRIASFAAKQALLGNKVFIVNSEEAFVSGNKRNIIERYLFRKKLGGSSLKGPYHSKDEEKIVKRSIRGMLPDYRRGRGKEAWVKIKCFKGIPLEYKNEKFTKLEVGKPKKYITLKEMRASL